MILVVALVIGLISAVALYSYMTSVEARAYEGAELVEVFVVKKEIPRGTLGDDAIGNELIAADEMPQEYRPDSALTDLTPIRGKVAITDLKAGQVVVDGLFLVPTEVPGGTISSQLDEGEVAVTVSVDQVRGVGGNLLPGDRVNMLVSLVDTSQATEGEAAQATDDSNKQVRYLYQNVKILAIGQNAAPGLGETEASNPGSDLITFAVPPEAAQRIVFAGSDRIYLTLVPKDNQPIPLAPVTIADLFPERLTPYPDES
jgi:pilus assembly protein CpaB